MQNIAQIILLWLNTMPQNMWLLTESKTTENWPFCAGKLLRKIIGVGRSAIRFSNLQTCWKFDQNAICYQVIENQQDPYCTTAWQYSLQNSTEKPARTGKKNHTLSNVRIKKKKKCCYFEIRCPWQQWKDLQVPQNKTTIWQQEINHELQRDGEGKLPKPTTCTAGKKACNLFWHVHPHKWIQIIHLLNSSASPSPTSNESSMECRNAVQWHWLYRRANMLKWSNSIKLWRRTFLKHPCKLNTHVWHMSVDTYICTGLQSVTTRHSQSAESCCIGSMNTVLQM